MAAVKIGNLWINPDHIITVSDITSIPHAFRFQVFVGHGFAPQFATFQTMEEAQNAHRQVIDAIARY